MKIRRLITVLLLSSLVFMQCILPAAAIESMEVEAKAALLVDAETGTILYEQNAHAQLSPASITKVMTALLVFEAIDRGELRLDTPITASSTALEGLPHDGSTADIMAGETLSAEELLYCMLVVSANETCNIFAEKLCGTVEAFVEKMNERAQELGCENTHFCNPTGLTENNHYTSAYDIYLFTKEAMKYEDFMTICNTKAYTVPPTNSTSKERELHSTNYLISNWRATGYLYSGAEGIKTGTTEAAGNCLVSSAVRGNRRLISVVLGAQTVADGKGGVTVQSFTETSRLFDWGFDNFSTKTIIESEELVQEIPVSLSKETNYIVVHPAFTATAILPNDIEAKDLERNIKLVSESVSAPIKEDDELGTITLSYNGHEYVTVPLLALTDVNASRFLVAKNAVENFFAKTIVRIILIALVVVIIAFVVWFKVFRRQRRYGRHSRYRGGSSYRGRRR